MKTKLLTIAMTAALMLTAMTKVQAQSFDGPCLPSMHGLDDHQSAFCGSTLTQTIALSAGVNWFSTYVEIALDDLKAALVDALGTSATITVRSQTQNVKYNRGRWAGQLEELDLAYMYKIEVPQDCEITLEGAPVNPEEHHVTVPANGKAWMAYPFNVETTNLANFFGTFPINEDVVRSQFQNSKYNRGRWGGSLTKLEPGKGYMYESAGTEERTFYFPSQPSKK